MSGLEIWIKWPSKRSLKTISTIKNNSLKKLEKGEKQLSAKGENKEKLMMAMTTSTKIKFSPTLAAIINIRMLMT